jgi:phosphatidylserine/phosphatidylglycerophosphate/cardiolipin synthase-like enzyme
VNIKNNLNLVEIASLGLSSIGTVAAITTQQIAYAAAPLTVALSIGFLNRQQASTRTNKWIASLERQIASDRKSLADLQQEINAIEPKDDSIVLESSYARFKHEYDAKIEALDSTKVDVGNAIDDLYLQIKDLTDTSDDSNLSVRIDELNDSVKTLQARQLELEKNIVNNYDYFTERIPLSLEQSTQLLTQTIDRYFPKYEYELVVGRAQSRQNLLAALDSTADRLILVCPWLCHYGFDLEVREKLEKLLKKQAIVEIGYGKLSDIEYGKLKGKFYNSLNYVTTLSMQYPNLRLKLIGTHEKYLVCDRTFATLGSHNFLTSGAGEEREIGIKITDIDLIDRLISTYDRAPDLQESYVLN